MSKLHSIENTELSDYCVNVLAKHDILLVGDFVSENSDNLMKILNINTEQLHKIKTILKRLYGPVCQTFAEVNEVIYYATYIGPLDDVLELCALSNQSVWEICGPSGVGKTQLALTLTANFVQLHHLEALYIDTKLDFSARRVKNILNSRQLQLEVVAGCLQAIKVERVFSAQAVVELLDCFLKELLNGSHHVNNIKLIVIDSLPSVWFLLKADSNRLAGRWLLSRLVNLAYRLANEYHIWIVFVNLSVIPSSEQVKEGTQSASNEEEDEVNKSLLDDEENNNETAGKLSTYRQIMGHYWSSKPHIRLSVEFTSDNYKDTRSPRRIIKVLQTSLQSSSFPSCNVRLCEQGVV